MWRGLCGIAVAAIAELRLRRDLKQLRGLDDRLLADIGLRKGGLESAVRHGRMRPADDNHRKT